MEKTVTSRDLSTCTNINKYFIRNVNTYMGHTAQEKKGKLKYFHDCSEISVSDFSWFY